MAQVAQGLERSRLHRRQRRHTATQRRRQRRSSCTLKREPSLARARARARGFLRREKSHPYSLSHGSMDVSEGCLSTGGKLSVELEGEVGSGDRHELIIETKTLDSSDVLDASEREKTQRERPCPTGSKAMRGYMHCGQQEKIQGTMSRTHQGPHAQL